MFLLLWVIQSLLLFPILVVFYQDKWSDGLEHNSENSLHLEPNVQTDGPCRYSVWYKPHLPYPRKYLSVFKYILMWVFLLLIQKDRSFDLLKRQDLALDIIL